MKAYVAVRDADGSEDGTVAWTFDDLQVCLRGWKALRALGRLV